MRVNYQKAFTMVELIFVIVIIGILSAIAIPKLAGTATQAHLAKAKTVLASVRSSMSTERQKRILRGDITTHIGDLGSTISGTDYAFSYFEGNNTGTRVLQYPVKHCVSETCWQRVSALKYVYHFPDTGEAKFEIVNNRLVCDDDAADCAKLE